MPDTPQQIDYRQVFQQLRVRPTAEQLTYIFERMREAGWDTPAQPREADTVAGDLPQRRAQVGELFEAMKKRIAEQDSGDAGAGWAWLEQAIAEEDIHR
ncbi:hypothetical protein OG874_00665 [Nocardia sp. NBC_00565]|uniref:hypothetical protein n=1 Tax=Nocardia sp. NBC_00565 TaxID=2975993 RepID=UPI002E80145B|nr:hypothetical protein [Nocardia sp. NBC_00565]WUC03768.1 hypothetical protein OG874_00665 [Nocardia sp. NBC_00565]